MPVKTKKKNPGAREKAEGKWKDQDKLIGANLKKKRAPGSKFPSQENERTKRDGKPGSEHRIGKRTEVNSHKPLTRGAEQTRNKSILDPG